MPFKLNPLTGKLDLVNVAGTGGTAAAFSAGVSTLGNTSGTTGTVSNQLILAGGNNITLSQSTAAGGATVTISAPNQTVQTQNMVSLLGSTGNISFANSNGITFGGNASTVTASHNGLTQQSTQPVAASASNGSYNFSTLRFVEGSGVTWATQAGGIQASVKTDYQTSGAYLTTAMLSNASTQFVQANAAFAGTNASGTIASNGISVSVNPAAAGVAIVAGTRTATTAGELLFDNANGITFGLNGNGSSIMTASHNGLTSQSNQALSGSNGSFTFQTATLTGSGAVQVYTTNGSSLVISAPSQTVQPVAVSGSNGSFNFSTATFGNLNGISFYTSNGSMVASHNGLTTARASNDAVGLNTAFTAGPLAWTVNSSGISLNAGSAAGTTSGFAGNSISGSITHNTAGINISLNHPAWLTTAMQSNAATISNINLSAGTTSTNASAFTFANANGISFGLGTGASAGSITASHNGLTTARASNDAIGLNTAQTNVTWTVNSSGISLNAGGYAGTGTSATNASVTLNTNGLAISVAAPGGGVTPALSGSNGSFSFSTATFGNLNGMSFYTSNGSMVGSYTVPTQTNPGASASNGSFSFQTLNFSNANNVTFGTSAGGIVTASVAAPGAAAENNWVNLLGANTAGNTTASGSTIGYSGINLTLSGTNGSVVNISAPATSSLSATGQLSISTNGSTISIGVGRTISGAILAPGGGMGGPLPFAQSSISLGQNSLYVYPFQLEDYLTADHIRLPTLITNSSSAVSSGQKAVTFRFGIYTRNATNNTVLSQHYSTSYTMQASFSSNVSWALSMITAIGNSTSYNSVTASSAGLNLSASLHGPRELIMPVSSVFTPGDYWFALAQSTAGSGTVGNVLNISNLAVAYQTYNRPGQSTASSNSGFFQMTGMGLYSTTTGALPGGISQTQLNLMGTQPIMFAGTGTV